MACSWISDLISSAGALSSLVLSLGEVLDPESVGESPSPLRPSWSTAAAKSSPFSMLLLWTARSIHKPAANDARHNARTHTHTRTTTEAVVLHCILGNWRNCVKISNYYIAWSDEVTAQVLQEQWTTEQVNLSWNICASSWDRRLLVGLKGSCHTTPRTYKHNLGKWVGGVNYRLLWLFRSSHINSVNTSVYWRTYCMFLLKFCINLYFLFNVMLNLTISGILCFM